MRAGLFLAWRVYFEIELYAMLFLVMCKSLLCAFYFEIELYAMLFLVMCTSFCVLNYFSSRSLHGFTLVYALTCRCTGACRSCVLLHLYFIPGGASTNGLLYADAVRRGEA